jgi:hypothetical protein
MEDRHGGSGEALQDGREPGSEISLPPRRVSPQSPSSSIRPQPIERCTVEREQPTACQRSGIRSTLRGAVLRGRGRPVGRDGSGARERRTAGLLPALPHRRSGCPVRRQDRPRRCRLQPNPPADYTPTIGGLAGQRYQLACDANEVLVGVYGRSGASIDRVGAQCIRLDRTGNWMGDPVDRAQPVATAAGRSPRPARAISR